ncbi:hypothetical protein RHOSPDRAFT_35131 [Rhodotorula sp. JG-1b]|nr:hypothetical protein RHOSPDRAFT_35131 [Rhodotorula sp. JG-1b]
MSIPSYSFFDRQEADDLSQLNKRNYQSLADSVGFDSVVLKQRESDKAILAKERGVAVSSSTPLSCNQNILAWFQLCAPSSLSPRSRSDPKLQPARSLADTRPTPAHTRRHTGGPLRPETLSYGDDRYRACIGPLHPPGFVGPSHPSLLDCLTITSLLTTTRK